MKTNKEVVIDFSKRLWDERDLSVIDEYVDTHAQIHGPVSTLHGKVTIRHMLEKWLAAFPDLLLTWEEIIAEGDKVVTRFSAVATYLGGFFDTKPTYKDVCFNGVIIYRLVDQKIVDYWSLVDMHAILSQLGEYSSMTEAFEEV